MQINKKIIILIAIMACMSLFIESPFMLYSYAEDIEGTYVEPEYTYLTEPDMNVEELEDPQQFTYPVMPIEPIAPNYIPDQDGDGLEEPDENLDGIYIGTQGQFLYIDDQDGDGKPETERINKGEYKSIFAGSKTENNTVVCAYYHEDTANHSVLGTNWSALPEVGGVLTAGRYYVDQDMELSIPIEISERVTICLNGHKISGDGSGIVVKDQGVLRICDCAIDNTGTIEINGTHSAIVEPGGTLEMYGGTFKKGQVGRYDGYNVVSIQGKGGSINGGTFNMYAGSIQECYTTADGTVYNAGSFKMYGKSTISNNIARNGGAVLNSGTLDMHGLSSISHNVASEKGGGIFNWGGTANLEGTSSIHNNEAQNGGGVYCLNCPGFVVNSSASIKDNSAYAGGGVVLEESSITISSNGMITGNTASVAGGIYHVSGSATITLSGKPRVIGNTSKITGKPSNLYLEKEKNTVVDIKALSNTAKIGITCDLSDINDKHVFASGDVGKYADEGFFVGDQGYVIEKGDIDLKDGKDELIISYGPRYPITVVIRDEDKDKGTATCNLKDVASGGVAEIIVTPGLGYLVPEKNPLTFERSDDPEGEVVVERSTVSGVFFVTMPTFPEDKQAGASLTVYVNFSEAIKVDTDGDGVFDSFEMPGVDPDGDGVYTDDEARTQYYPVDVTGDGQTDHYVMGNALKRLDGDALFRTDNNNDGKEDEDSPYYIARYSDTGHLIGFRKLLDNNKNGIYESIYEHPDFIPDQDGDGQVELKNDVGIFVGSVSKKKYSYIADKSQLSGDNNDYFVDSNKDGIYRIANPDSKTDKGCESTTGGSFIALVDKNGKAVGVKAVVANNNGTFTDRGTTDKTADDTIYIPDQDKDGVPETYDGNKGVYIGSDTEKGYNYIPSEKQNSNGKPEEYYVDSNKDGVYDKQNKETGAEATNTDKISYIEDRDGDGKPETSKNNGAYIGSKDGKTYSPIKPGESGDGKYKCVSACSICGGCTDPTCEAEDCYIVCSLQTMRFTDVKKGEWYSDAISYAYHHKIMTGVASNYFDVNGSTNRGMLVTALWRMEGSPVVSRRSVNFKDIYDGEWYYNAVLWAANTGIVTGHSDGNFKPYDNILREEFATILYRYADYKKYDVSVSGKTNLNKYADASSVDSYAMNAVKWACSNGLMEGDGVYLTPLNTTTRAESATLLQRFCEEVAK